MTSATDRTASQPSVLESIVELVHRLRDEPLGDEERAAARRCLIDSVGCALAGMADKAARRTASAFAPAPRGAPERATVIGSTTAMPLRDALLVNAAAIRALDFNDVYSGRNNHHPSEAVVPLSLGIAESSGWDGGRLLEAVACGYRISLTVGELWNGLLGRGWAPAASLGQISNAAFIGCLLDLDDIALANGMAIAAVTAPALAAVFRGELSDTKSLVSGLAAQAAWQAVQLAAAGVTGPRDVFEGSGGYDEMVGGEPALDRLSTSDRTDARAVQQKAFPTVFTIHAAIEAALETRSRLGVDAAALLADPRSTVTVTVPSKVATMAAAPARWKPVNRESAQFSLPYGVATALLTGACTADALEDAVDGSSATTTADLVARTTVVPDDRWGQYSGGSVSVASPSGTVESEVTDPRGTATNPLSNEEVEAKFLDLAAHGRGDAFARGALEHLLALDSTTQVADLVARLGAREEGSGGSR